MKTIIFTLSLLFLSANFLLGQSKKRAFFIGNSYTQYNNLPNLINTIANNHGDTLESSSNTPGGAQLVQHVINANTLNGIRQGNWDFVVIQEQSQKPSFPQAPTDVYPYAAQLNDSIEYYNPCGETVFYMTWGRKNGDPQWAPISTFDGMNTRLRNAYLQMTVDNDAICSPVGAVWKAMRDSFPTVELYTADGSHPSYAGSYLAACTFYATMFRKPLTGTTFYGSLTAATAQNIHTLVDLVVLDSLDNWSIGAHDVQADFSATVNLDSVMLTNNSDHSTSYTWDFGDGSPLSTDTNPVHGYDSTGNFNIILIASDSCGNSDTTTQNVTVSLPTNVQQDAANEFTIDCYPNPVSDYLTITANELIEEVRLFNSLGEEIFYRKSMKTQKNVLYLKSYARGVYILKIKTSTGKSISKKLVLQ